MFKPSGFNVNNGNNVNQGKTWSLSPRPIQEMAADELLVWWLASPCVFFSFAEAWNVKKRRNWEKRNEEHSSLCECTTCKSFLMKRKRNCRCWKILSPLELELRLLNDNSSCLSKFCLKSLSVIQFYQTDKIRMLCPKLHDLLQCWSYCLSLK